MENTSNIPIAYPDWFADWKKRIQSAQIKAALHVSRELLLLYWELGQDIAAKQETTPWGEGLIPRFSKDLKAAFPHLTGFSPRNLFYIRKWHLFYREEVEPIVPQVAGQLGNVSVQQLAAQLQPFDNEQLAFFVLVPWAHHPIILDKCKDIGAHPDPHLARQPQKPAALHRSTRKRIRRRLST